MQRTVTPLAWLSICFAVFLLSAAAVLATPSRALADCPLSITVTNTGDNGSSSLRQAMVNLCPGGVIDFAPALTSSGPATITLTTGELVIDKDMTIDGPGADLLAVSGNNTSRVFNVSGGVSAIIDGLTVRDGSDNGGSGGGGIYNAGVLTVTHSVVADNFAEMRGGGIYNDGASAALTVTHSALIGNGNGGTRGGGVSTEYGRLVVINSTFQGNGQGRNVPVPSVGGGGGINAANADVVVINSTFSGNTGGFGSSIRTIGGSITFTNTILEKSQLDIGCLFTSATSTTDGGGNIDDDGSCGFDPANGSLSGVNPRLAPLGDYGGGAPTMAPLPGSPAIDGGIDRDCPADDERGVSRPVGNACDSGAFESRGFKLTITGASPVATISTAFSEPLTVTVNSDYAEPVGPGGLITFVPPVTGPGLTTTGPFDVATDDSGFVSSGIVTANNIVGSYGVTATAGVNIPVSVTGAGIEHIVVAGKETAAAEAVFNLTNCGPAITVTSTDDNGAGTLREAIRLLCTGGAIDFAPALTANGPATITLTTGELLIDKNVTINGPGADLLAVSGGHVSRVFNVSGDGAATLDGLTVRDGNSGNDHGGGIFNNGTLTVTNSTIAANGAGAGGGGIHSYGALTVINSTVSGNNANQGGGLTIYSGALTVINSTVTSNSATYEGGGITNRGGALAITNSTLSGNSAPSGGGNLFSDVSEGGSSMITNSILAQSAGGDNCSLAGAMTDGGGNIEDGSSCGFSAGNGSFSNTNPLLSALGNYGGGAQTMALLPGSPAIDGGSDINCPATDQRGVYRPQGVACDSGAFESQGFALAISGGSPQTTDVFSAFAEPLTVTVSSYNNEPVGPGGVITYTPPSEGPGLNTTVPFTAATDVNGLAGSGVVTANNIAGSYGVTVTLRGEGMAAACGDNPCGGSPVFDLANERILPDLNLSSSPNPSVFNEAVSLSLAVTTSVSGAGMPTGVVTFTVDGDFMGTDMLDADGGATIIVNGLTVGDHAVAVEYEGDSAYLSKQSDPITHVVNKAPTTATLKIRPGQAFYGDQVSFGISVERDMPAPAVLRAATIPSGVVTVNDTSGVIRLQGRLVDGKTILSSGIIPAGTYSVTATYMGDDNYASSTSQEMSLVIEKYSTTTELSSSRNPAFVGDPVYFTAVVGEVMPAAVRDYNNQATPTGAVVISDPTGMINLGGSLTDGTLQIPAPALPAGTYTVTAVYLGDERYAPSTSTQVIQVVERQPTGTALSVSPNPTNGGEEVTFTAAVSVQQPGLTSNRPASRMSGHVVFTYDGIEFGRALVSSGVATLRSNLLPVGTHQITAEYLGDNAFIGSTSGPVTLVIDKFATSTTLASSSNPAYVGDPLNFTVQVGEVLPNVVRQLGMSGPSGAVVITDSTGTINLGGSLVNGEVTLNAPQLAAGTYTLTAAYLGDDRYASSVSTQVIQIVKKHETVTTLESSSNPIYVGDAFRFGVQVNEMAIAAESRRAAPTGAVVITDPTGAINLGGSLVDGRLQLPAPQLAAGTYTVTAAYAGDNGYAPSVSTQLIQVVDRQPTSTALMLDPIAVLIGETIHLTAAVGPVNPTALDMFGGPTGSVEFLADGAPLGSAPLSRGQATLSAPATRAGSFAITAHYLGDTRYMGSTSGPVTLTVAKRATGTTLTAAPNPAKEREAVIFTAAVAEQGSSSDLQPSGAVIFASSGVEFGRADVQGGVATLSTASLPVGSLTITAEYVGDNAFTGSKSADLQQVVQPMPLAVNDAAGAQEQPVTIDVTANDLDPAGGGLAVVSVGVPQFGSATIAPEGPRVVYTPPADFSGVDTFTYVVQDKNGNQDEALVAVVVTRIIEGQGKPQVQAADPTTETTALFGTPAITVSVQAPAGFYTGTLTDKDILFISFTPVVTPTEGTNNPPAGLKFGNAEYVLEVYLNGQLLTGQSFAVPLVVAIHYDPAVLGSLKPETLGLWYWDGAVWSTDGVTILSNDVASHTLTVSMTHFSLYAFFAAAPTDLDPGNEPDSPYKVFMPAVNR